MVWFVGAGSGAPDLITLRGQKRLSEADVIIYAGSLVNPELLEYARPGCTIYDSAKMTLEEVIEVILEAHSRGEEVVRLHTGDPSLYGAIKEQMDILDEHGIKYEVVPGVSSFSAAAASLCAEYTLPGVSQTLILTRMAGRTPVPEGEGIERLAQSGSSMAIFLSSSMLDKLQEKLLLGAYTAETPCAIVYKASWPDEKVFRCNLGSLAECGRQNEISKTALVLVGSFLGSDYDRSRLYDPTFTTEFRQAKL